MHILFTLFPAAQTSFRNQWSFWGHQGWGETAGSVGGAVWAEISKFYHDIYFNFVLLDQHRLLIKYSILSMWTAWQFNPHWMHVYQLESVQIYSNFKISKFHSAATLFFCFVFSFTAMWTGSAVEENPLGVKHRHCSEVPGGKKGKQSFYSQKINFL